MIPTTSQKPCTRKDLASKLQHDAALARAWSVRRQTRPGTTIGDIMAADSFAQWCEITAADLQTAEVINLESLTRNWQREAERSRIEYQSFYAPLVCLALIPLAFAALLFAALTGLDWPAMALLTTAAGGVPVHRVTPTPRLKVGPTAPKNSLTRFRQQHATTRSSHGRSTTRHIDLDLCEGTSE